MDGVLLLPSPRNTFVRKAYPIPCFHLPEIFDLSTWTYLYLPARLSIYTSWDLLSIPAWDLISRNPDLDCTCSSIYSCPSIDLATRIDLLATRSRSCYPMRWITLLRNKNLTRWLCFTIQEQRLCFARLTRPTKSLPERFARQTNRPPFDDLRPCDPPSISCCPIDLLLDTLRLITWRLAFWLEEPNRLHEITRGDDTTRPPILRFQKMIPTGDGRRVRFG